MIRKVAWSMLGAAALLAACAQKPAMQAAAPPPPQTTMICDFQWCPIYVVVGPNLSGTTVATLQWDQVKMQRAYSDGTLAWNLYAPDYEFRADSVRAIGANAAGAWTEFPVRQITDTRFALDGLNKNSLTYEYEVRVYRKGTPANSPPLVAHGTVVNAVN